MTNKIFSNILVVSIIATLICIFSISSVLYNYFDGIIKADLKTEADLIASSLEQDSEFLRNISSSENRITLINEDGEVIYDSEVTAINMENHKNREEFKSAVKEGEAYSTRYSNTLGIKTIYYARVLDNGNILRISQQQNAVWMLLKGLFVPLIFLFAAIVIIAYFISKNAAKRIVRPINEMDTANEDAEEPYPELAPLIIKIRQQNLHIKEQMAELERAQKEFKAITENMSEGFIVIDNSMEILSYNTAAVRLLGCVADNPHKVFELNRHKAFRNAVEGSLSGNSTLEMLETDTKYYNIMANPVYEDNRIAGAVIIILDVTEKEKRENLRREFTSNVSHELKTPLTTIYGVSDMLTSGIVKNEDIQGFAESIKSEALRMINLIDDIIKLSRLDENIVKDEFSKVDLFETAEAVINYLSNYASEKNIKMTLKGESVLIDSIPHLCEEIIYNLCENAIKYNNENGNVDITISQSINKCKIQVSDTGIGIPYEYQDRIFERFFRVDKSRGKNGQKGTGLGLSIVKNSVDYLGGNIEIKSEEGKGTCISVIFDI